jgi:hypothetical protein
MSIRKSSSGTMMWIFPLIEQSLQLHSQATTCSLLALNLPLIFPQWQRTQYSSLFSLNSDWLSTFPMMIILLWCMIQKKLWLFNFICTSSIKYWCQIFEKKAKNFKLLLSCA